MATVEAELVVPVVLPPTNLPETDGVPVETPWHRDEINLLIESVTWRWHGLNDFFVGGDMFLYFSLDQVRNRDYRGPDFLYVKDVDRTRKRLYWAVWDEGGRYPNVIIELLSPTTAMEDRTTKKTLYEQTFRTPEYFLYDPDSESLEGWRLAGPRYQPIRPNERGWLWSEQLQLWLGTWEGKYLDEHATWLRFYDSNSELALVGVEAEQQRADTEQQRADTERQRADTERQRADTERRRAEAERARAEAAEAELERIKAQRADPTGL